MYVCVKLSCFAVQQRSTHCKRATFQFKKSIHETRTKISNTAKFFLIELKKIKTWGKIPMKRQYILQPEALRRSNHWSENS